MIITLAQANDASEWTVSGATVAQLTTGAAIEFAADGSYAEITVPPWTRDVFLKSLSMSAMNYHDMTIEFWINGAAVAEYEMYQNTGVMCWPLPDDAVELIRIKAKAPGKILIDSAIYAHRDDPQADIFKAVESEISALFDNRALQFGIVTGAAGAKTISVSQPNFFWTNVAIEFAGQKHVVKKISESALTADLESELTATVTGVPAIITVPFYKNQKTKLVVAPAFYILNFAMERSKDHDTRLSYQIYDVKNDAQVAISVDVVNASFLIAAPHREGETASLVDDVAAHFREGFLIDMHGKLVTVFIEPGPVVEGNEEELSLISWICTIKNLPVEKGQWQAKEKFTMTATVAAIP